MPKRRGIPPGQRFRILERDDYTCFWCGRSAPLVALEIDHILAVADGGDNDDDNLVAACRGCNVGKSRKHVDLGRLGGANRLYRIVWPDGTVAHKRWGDLTILDLTRLAEHEEANAERHASEARSHRLMIELMRRRGASDDARLYDDEAD